MRRNDGQMRKGPLAALDLELFRHGNGEQMADRRGDDVLVVLVEVRVLLELAERLGDVSGDGRLFRDDKCFTHAIGKLLCCPTAVAQLKFFIAQNNFNPGGTRKDTDLDAK